jgi:hypothetical protein
MKPLCTSRSTRALGVALVASAAALGSVHQAAARKIPQMTIKIYNNDPNYNIYPVLTTGTSSSNLWLQAWFGITKAQAKKAADAGKPFYPKNNNFRIYINPTGVGIPPKGSVTLKLPFITQLVPTNQINPRQDDQFIDWWGGGRVEIFAAPVADGKPPAELTALYTKKPGQTEINLKTLPDGSVAPTCPACQQPLQAFKDKQGVFKNNAPSQLTEYTLGVINQDNDPPTLGTFFGAVDIDVSYVDTAYLPAAMAPFNPTAPDLNQVGYVGTPLRIDRFKAALEKFIGPKSRYKGWPQFVSDDNKKEILKLSSTAHASAGDPDLTPPRTWLPITKLTTNWNNCLAEANQSQFCKDLRDVRQMFIANYDNYKAIFATSPSCDQTKGPVDRTEKLLISHVYGFTPFGENCSDPKVNLLEKTPGYADNNSRLFRQVKDTFDGLQYWPDGSFNPYVVLIHGENATPEKPGTGYINAPNVYAYSVDDAVGNLQADGSGFIIAVGGVRGLPNPNPAAPPVDINFGGPNEFGEWTHFGVCTTDKTKMREVNPDFRSTAFYVQKENLDKCPISLLGKWKPGGEEVVYSFKLKTLTFPYGDNNLSPITHAPIDCSGLDPIPTRLCNDIFAYALKNPGRGPDARKVIVPAMYPHN